MEGMYLGFDRRSAYFNFSEREQEAQDFAKDPAHLSPMDPVLQFTEDEKEVINKHTVDLQKAGKEFATKYVLNNGGDKEWNEWLKKAEQLGAKKVVDVYNNAQKRYDSK